MKILVSWRGNSLNVEVNQDLKVKDLGDKLQEVTNVKPDTMRLFVSQVSSKGSRMISPFSDEYSGLRLHDLHLSEGKPIRMMGVSNNEVEEVSDNVMRPDGRIIGFEEEEKRFMRRSLNKLPGPLKLPTGKYIFCDFRTLHLPGVELNPPASEALRRMHKLACDPGIIAIMNKHCWRVGIMTEMAPVGYVGVSPKCILGFNKNKGEEISLRLRTDDLKGFRKYESIKKTLLHELAHMVYSEHDADFFALNKQLNEEAATLDWTRSRSNTLSGRRITDHFDEDSGEFSLGGISFAPQKLGGTSVATTNACAASVTAAYQRFLRHDHQTPNDNQSEPDPDDSEAKYDQVKVIGEPDPDYAQVVKYGDMVVDIVKDPDSVLENRRLIEPDPDDSVAEGFVVSTSEPDPDDSEVSQATKMEPDPDDSLKNKIQLGRKREVEPTVDDSEQLATAVKENIRLQGGIPVNYAEPDPDDSSGLMALDAGVHLQDGIPVNYAEPDPDDSSGLMALDAGDEAKSYTDDIKVVDNVKNEPDPDDHVGWSTSQEIQIMEEPVVVLCRRIQSAIDRLKKEVRPVDSISVLQTLFMIVKNVIEHPEETKFRRLRKGNPHFQRNVANYTAAMEVLNMIGFSEDVVPDEVRGAENYMVLKRNDPGLLWLARSCLEESFA